QENDGGIGALAIQPDGKIVFATDRGLGTGIFGSGDADFAVVRLRPDGSLDPTFGDDADSGRKGYVTTDFDGSEFPAALAIQSDGKILVGGTRTPLDDSSWVLARYTTDGRLDNTFGGDGKVVTTFL